MTTSRARVSQCHPKPFDWTCRGRCLYLYCTCFAAFPQLWKHLLRRFNASLTFPRLQALLRLLRGMLEMESRHSLRGAGGRWGFLFDTHHLLFFFPLRGAASACTKYLAVKGDQSVII